tara:strand:+ start:171 stop:800 length:630 start_codon:yes stop_codon:yes gene_type:complete
MKTEPIFPILIGKSKLLFNSDTVKIWKKYIKTTEKTVVSHEHINLNPELTEDYLTVNERILDGFIFKELRENILTEARLYAQECGISFEDLQICNSWGYQIGLNNNPSNFHTHANSMLSGVYYLTPGSPIEFKSNNFPISKNPFPFNLKNSPTPEKFFHQIAPKENLLIFFPSELEHKVTKNFIDERFCIAFNIIPKGFFGAPYSNFTL